MIDRERVEQVIAMLKNSSAMELAVREEGLYIRVRRAPVVAPTVHAGSAHAARGVTEAVPVADAGGAVAPDDLVVKARLVGRFYRGKGPGQPPLVNIGDTVQADAPIATIEALGKITVVPAPEAGDVIEHLAEDGQSVEWGTPLIRIRTKQR
ncbi:MAG: hypothetical protein KBI47_02415 [Armatimonadetes bacterium]|jgi:biotin carboxyl carrier protein|nr:hypothetical protein [Armatimonadota bacterium]